MKFLSQIVLAIVAVVVLVAGVTYLSQFNTTGGGPADTPNSARPPAAEVTELDIPMKIFQWVPDFAGQFEVETSGHCDFWFENKKSEPIILGLSSKSCKCSDISVCVLKPEETEPMRRLAGATAAAEIASACQGVPGFAAMYKDTDKITGWLGAHLDWQPLSVSESQGVRVEPQSGGWIRVAFKGEKSNNGRLAIGIWTLADSSVPSPRLSTRLEVPIAYMPVLRTTDALNTQVASVSVGDLNYGEEGTVEFQCWSSSRASFSLKASESRNDPCFECTCTPMTYDECLKLSEKVKARVLSGYNVKVTVHEHVASGSQLDLGILSRGVTLTSDADIEAVSMNVRGSVAGDIIVGADEDKGRVVLGSFSAKQGQVTTIRLTGLRPGLELQIDRIEPATLDYVKVKSLTKVRTASTGTSDWNLCVEAVPGCPTGKLPTHSAIMLKMLGPNPRNIRIPLVGLAYQQ